MKRVVIECKGRLANQILCWANAVHVFEQLDIKDRVIVMNYGELRGAVLPGARVEAVTIAGLPRITRNEIASQTEDCLWAWEDIFSEFPDASVMKRIIQTIRFPMTCTRGHVGIHVRCGDYVEVDAANPPKVMPPFARAPKDYFLNAIKTCRERDPQCVFFVASDGTPAELEFLTDSIGSHFRRSDSALRDLFFLSQGRLIVGSNSTFSAVAAYYGNVPMVTPAMSTAEVRTLITSIL